MAILVPTTLLRVGILQGELLEVARRFDKRFELSDSVLGNTEQCELFDNNKKSPYIIRISKSLLGIEPAWKYNSMFTVTSYDPQLNERLYADFCSRTNHEFRDPPEFLERTVVPIITEGFVKRVEGMWLKE